MGNLVYYIFIFGIMLMIGIVASKIWPFVIGSVIFVFAYLFFESYNNKRIKIINEQKKEEELKRQEEIARKRKLNHEKSRISVMISDFFRIKSIQVRGQFYDNFSAFLETVSPELREFAIEVRNQKIGNQINETLIGLKHNGKLILEDLEFYHKIAENDLGWNKNFFPNAKKIIADMNSIGFRLYNPNIDEFLPIEEIISRRVPEDLTLDEAKARQHQIKVDFLGESTILNIDIEEMYKLILFFINRDLDGCKEVKELIRIYKFFSKRNKDIFMIELLIAARTNPDSISQLCSDFSLFRTSNVHYLNTFAQWFKKLNLTTHEMRALKLYMHHFKNHEDKISQRFERLQSGEIDKYRNYSLDSSHDCFQVDSSKANWTVPEYHSMVNVFDSERLQVEVPLVVFEEVITASSNVSLTGLTDFLIDFHRYASDVNPTIELTEVLDVSQEGSVPFAAVRISFDQSHDKLHNFGMIITIDTSDLSVNRISISQYVEKLDFNDTQFYNLLLKFAEKRNAQIRNTFSELYNSVIEYG